MKSNNLSKRELLKFKNDEVKKQSINEFIDGGSDVVVPVVTAVDDATKNPVGRPRLPKGEATQPVTCSLTPTDRKMLDGLARKTDNLLNADERVSRSSMVRAMTIYLSKQSDDELLSFYKENGL